MFTNGNCLKLKKTENGFYWVTRRRQSSPIAIVVVVFIGIAIDSTAVVFVGVDCKQPKRGAVEEQHLSRAASSDFIAT